MSIRPTHWSPDNAQRKHGTRSVKQLIYEQVLDRSSIECGHLLETQLPPRTAWMARHGHGIYAHASWYGHGQLISLWGTVRPRRPHGTVYVRGIDSSIFSLRYLILPQPAGFGSEPGTGSGMTVSVLGVTSYLGGVRTGL